MTAGAGPPRQNRGPAAWAQATACMGSGCGQKVTARDSLHEPNFAKPPVPYTQDEQVHYSPQQSVLPPHPTSSLLRSVTQPSNKVVYMALDAGTLTVTLQYGKDLKVRVGRST